MRQFEDLIRFSAEQYKKESFCIQCALGNCRKCNTNDCYLCLKYIHSKDNRYDHYPCKKITFNYILKYGYRYASEMAWAFFDIKNTFSSSQPIYIFSIGCGPSTELYGASVIYKHNPIYYYGFDLNDKWKIIQEYNIEKLENDNFHINYLGCDFISYVRSNNLKCDILVMNYLLSDFIKFHPKECNDFLDELISLISEGRFQVIIINDIMLMYGTGTGYSCMEKIAKNVKDTPLYSFNFERRHFAFPNQWQFPYGTKHRNEILTDQIDVEAIPFDPFKTCGSIQLIIKTTKKIHI